MSTSHRAHRAGDEHPPEAIAEEDRAQLVRLDRYYRVLLAGDNQFAVDRLLTAGLVEILRQSRPKPALYRLTAAGLAACADKKNEGAADQ